MGIRRPSTYSYPPKFTKLEDAENYVKRLYAELLENDSRGEEITARATDKDLKALIVRPEWYGAKGDGTTNDTSAIQAAITAAEHKIVFLSPKTYLISSVLTLIQGTQICGCGKDSIIYQSAAAKTGIQLHHDVVLYNFALRGPSGSVTSVASGIQGAFWGANSLIRDSTDTGWLGNRSKIINMAIYDFGSSGISGLPNYCTVENCKIYHCFNEGVLLSGFYSNVVNNFISDVNSWGIDINGSYNNVSGNHLYDCGDSVALSSEDGGSIVVASHTLSAGTSGNKIVNNTIDTSTTWGILLLAPSTYDYELHDTIVSGNHITNVNTAISGEAGAVAVIDESTSGGKLKNTSIVDNSIDSPGLYQGVRIQNISDLTISGNQITDTPGEGIYIFNSTFSSKRIIISGNTISRFKIRAISANAVEGLTISGNNIGECLSVSSWYSILINGCDNYLIIGNRMDGDTSNGYGIFISGTSTQGVISGNTIRDFITAIYYSASGQALDIVGNDLARGNTNTHFLAGTYDTVRLWRNVGVKLDEIVGGSLSQNEISGIKTTEIPTFKSTTLTGITETFIPYRKSVVEKVTNGTMESWTSATDLDNWTEVIVGTSTVNREGTDKYAGTYSCRFDIDSSNSNAAIVQGETLVAASSYKLSLWYKTAASKTINLDLRDTSNAVYLKSNGAWAVDYSYITLPAATAWTQYVLYFMSHASYTAYQLSIGPQSAASSSFYIDNVSIEETGILANSPISTDGTDVDNSGVYKVDAVQVVGNRVIDARCDDAINSGDATTDGVIDSLRDAMIQHGLLAAA
jgi:hypothetical protein